MYLKMSHSTDFSKIVLSRTTLLSMTPQDGQGPSC
jgi:hypothetical protein